MIPAKIGAYLARLAELAHGYGVCTVSVEHLAVKGHRCERTIKRHTKYLRERYLITVNPRLRENGSCTTNEIRISWDNPFFDKHLRNRCVAETSASGTVTKESPPDESTVAMDGCQSPSLVEEKLTDPKTEPIHETKQQPPNKAQLFDNVYSENAAETPIKTPVFEPDVQHVQAFRQTLANWFGVAVSFQTTLWLLCFMTVRRWNIRAFLCDVDHNHKPRLFHSQDAAWRFMAADYLSRGPTLESYPPAKRDTQTVAPMEQSAISVQQSAEHPPPESPPVRPKRMTQISSGVLKFVAPPASSERIAELCAEAGITEDQLIRWMRKRRDDGYAGYQPPMWPPGEKQVRQMIREYGDAHPG
jgi:hypothetical protein